MRRHRHRRVGAPWRRGDEMQKGRRRDCKLGREEAGWISEACRTNFLRMVKACITLASEKR